MALSKCSKLALFSCSVSPGTGPARTLDPGRQVRTMKQPGHVAHVFTLWPGWRPGRGSRAPGALTTDNWKGVSPGSQVFCLSFVCCRRITATTTLTVQKVQCLCILPGAVTNKSGFGGRVFTENGCSLSVQRASPLSIHGFFAVFAARCDAGNGIVVVPRT